MNLAAEVTKYIKHKVVLADVSNHYLEIARLQALQYCHSLKQMFCYQKQHLTPQDIARFVLQNKQHLFKILPHEENKSYKSSLEKYNKIIAEGELLLKPKTA